MKLILKNIGLLFLLLTLASCETKIERSYYKNGKVKEEFSKRNGKFVGEYKHFNEDGTISATGQFKSGIMNGTWYYYYQNGSLLSIQKIKEGKTIEINAWDSTGVQTIINGTGTAIAYTSDGKLLSKISYKDNVPHGKFESWHENGIKASEIFWDHGKPVDTWRFWHADGTLERTEKYDDNGKIIDDDTD